MIIHVPEQFETERLRIAAPSLEDIPQIYEAIHETMSDLKLWMPWVSPDYSMAMSEENTRLAIAKFITREDLRFHFHERSSGNLVVSSGLHRIDWKVPKFEIGYWCRKSAQGKGFVTEGVRALTRMAFKSLGAARVEIRCDDLNLKSAAIPERLGFTLDGILKHDSLSPAGDLRSTRVYSVTDLNRLT